MYELDTKRSLFLSHSYKPIELWQTLTLNKFKNSRFKNHGKLNLFSFCLTSYP